MNSKPSGENVAFWHTWALQGYEDRLQNEDYQVMTRCTTAHVGSVGFNVVFATFLASAPLHTSA